jgi:hypothetical protein
MRLDLIDEGLAALMEAAPPDRRAHAAVAAAALAFERAGIDDPLTRDALEGLDRGEPDPSLQPRLLELAQTFDERCWELEARPTSTTGRRSRGRRSPPPARWRPSSTPSTSPTRPRRSTRRTTRWKTATTSSLPSARRWARRRPG